MKLKSHSRSDFFECAGLAILSELVPMVAEEDKITLVVQSDDTPSLEVRHLWEKCCKHSADAVTKHRVEVVHDKLWVGFARRCTMVGDLVAASDAGDAEGGSRAVRKMAQDERMGLPTLLVPQHQVSEATLFCLFNHVLYLMILAFIVLDAREA